MRLEVSGSDTGWDPREAAAEHLLARARLDGVTTPPVRAVVAALGWRLSAGVPPGAHGWLDLESATVHVDDRSDRAGVSRRIAHELGHLAAMLAGVPHDERDADVIAAAVAVPRRWIRETVAEVGWDAPGLVARYPDAQALDVLTRAAVHAGGVAVVYTAGHRMLAVAAERTTVPMLPGERALVAATREARAPQRDPGTGLRAWPMDLPWGPAVVMLACLEDAGLV